MRTAILLLLSLSALRMPAQDAGQLASRLRAKMDAVRDYTATGTLKTDVSFLKVPVSKVQVFYKRPDRFRIRKDGGVSLLPKGGVSVNLNALMATGDVTAIAAGTADIDGRPAAVVKLLPITEHPDIILSTLYIDERNLLIRKAVTTTRENGTYEMTMYYGRYAAYGLPDRVVVSFNTKDYKLPKGITFEYETGTKPPQGTSQMRDRKGRVEISYDAYRINTGLDESVFK